MIMKKLSILFLILFLLVNSGIAQKKYAILFGGEDQKDPDNPMFAFKSGQSFNQQEAVWNDTYLMWELLINKGFDNDDIIVLYHTGNDYVRTPDGSNLDQRYDPQQEHSDLFPLPTDHLTKMASTKSNLYSAINTIKNKVNEEDFLVLLTYTHGGTNRFQCNNYDPNNSNTYVTAGNLSSWLSNVNCKKLILMQQCKSGSFIDELEGNNTIIMTATNDTCGAWVADEVYHYFNPVTGEFDYSISYGAQDEFEQYSDTHEHIHSEWFIHVYSALTGAMPDGNTIYETTYGNFPLSAADQNNDNFITLDEAHRRADEFDSQQNIVPWGSGGLGDDPQLSDQGYLGKTTSLEYPTMLSSDVNFSATLHGNITVLNHVHILSGHTLTLGPNSKIINIGSSSITVDAGASLVINDNVQISSLISNSGNININGNNINLSSIITIKSGGTVTLQANKIFNLTGSGKITVESSGNLVINNNYTINGTNTENKIIINGNVQIGTGVSFIAEAWNKFGGLVLSTNTTVSLSNCTFENADLTGYANSLTVTDCEFNNSYVAFTKGNLTVQNSNFAGTQLRATSPLSASEVIIDNCQVSDYNYSGIYINGYNSYTIENCSIQNNGYNGIYIYNAGSNSGIIKNNTITGNGTSNHAGIRIYNSYADVELNYIAENRYGIMCLNGSNTSLEGFPFACYPEETQRIENNDINQVYTSSLSFPDFFKYNSLLKQNTNYKVYYDGTPASELDVTYNFWGRRIYPQTDLYPDANSYYNYSPPWFYTLPRIRMSAAEKLYTEGVEEKEKGNFDNSQKKFQKVVEKYPESSFAIHSLKELLAVEELNKENYKDLKEYLLTEKKIQQNKSLKKLAHRLANSCDIKLKNYPQAIDWFEEIIENPETLEDSVFAIIDLAYTYFLMENEKSAYTGKRAEFKFETIAKFEVKREELIDLLFDQKTNNSVTEDTEIKEQENIEKNSFELNSEVDFKIFPNPFSYETQIQYSLNEPSQVLIRVFDYSGKEIKVLVNTYQDKGSYQQIFKADNLSPGIYFYSLELNGKLVKTNKMVIIE